MVALRLPRCRGVWLQSQFGSTAGALIDGTAAYRHGDDDSIQSRSGAARASKPNSGSRSSRTARKDPAKTETYAILANVQLESAFDEQTVPASREALLDRARQGYQQSTST